MFDKLKNKIKNLSIAFIYGLRNTEKDILGQKSTPNSPGSSVEQQMQMNELGEALLKGVVTEEVEKLRDRTYLVSDESKKYKVIIDTVGTSKAIKKKKMAKINPPKSFNEDGYDIKIVMNNDAIPTSVLDAFEAVGSYGIKDIYPLSFNYEYTPKFKLEYYVSRMAIRNNEDNNLRLDLYVPRFIDSYERLERIFDNELTKIYENKIKPFNISFKTLSFISNKAYGTDDLIPYEFSCIKFIGVSVFEDKYILTYDVEQIGNNEKITEKYKNKELRKAYENKESKNITLNLGPIEKKYYYCEKCGSLVDSEYDFRITKQTVGYGVCKNCLSKIIEKK